MAYCPNLLSSTWFRVFLTFVVTTIQADGDCPRYNSEEYDRRCYGPVPFYKQLVCEPVFKDGNCCAWRFDCDKYHDVVYRDKCYFKGTDKEYKIGERRNDVNPCGEKCFCEYKWDDFADFDCTTREKLCPLSKTSSTGCYTDSQIQCCPEQDVCQPEDPGCEWNGKSYIVGDFIVPENDSDSLCICKDHNLYLPPFPENTIAMNRKVHAMRRQNVTTNMFECEPLIGRDEQFIYMVYYKNCAPVYLTLYHNVYNEYERGPWRCQKADDFVSERYCPQIKGEHTGIGYTFCPRVDYVINRPLAAVHCPSSNQKEYNESSFKDDGCLLVNPQGYGVDYGLKYRELCRFGNLTMQIGESLNSIKYNSTYCTTCICQVPPVPTCFVWPNKSAIRYPLGNDKFRRTIIRC